MYRIWIMYRKHSYLGKLVSVYFCLGPGFYFMIRIRRTFVIFCSSFVFNAKIDSLKHYLTDIILMYLLFQNS